MNDVLHKSGDQDSDRKYDFFHSGKYYIPGNSKFDGHMNKMKSRRQHENKEADGGCMVIMFFVDRSICRQSKI